MATVPDNPMNTSIPTPSTPPRGPTVTTIVAIGCVLLGPFGAAACKKNEPPQLTSPQDQRATVQQLLELSFTAVDPEGDELTYAFDADLPGIGTRATMKPTARGARFSWTPLISDVGTHRFQFSVSDGANTTTRRLQIEVVSGEGSSAPVFVQPLGTGTTLDLGRAPCIDVPVAVTDPDTPGVTLGQADPVLDASELVQTTETDATWSWCPTREQIAASDRYTLRLTADDYDNPVTIKDYLLVLRASAGEDCPGEAPEIDHQPGDWDSVLDLPITATVRDAEGLKFEPLLYYSLRDPGSPPDITLMTQLTMSLSSGTMQDGTWTVAVPNPVANDPGASATVFYAIAATDNDDDDGNCDHTTEAPAGGTYQVVVSNGGSGGGGAEVCEPCSADVQCGGTDDHCLFLDSTFVCGAACDGDDDCPDDTYCSLSSYTSIDGAVARQCVPTGLSCTDPEPTCVDDSYEENDTQSAAASLGTGSYDMVICPEGAGSDEDWFEVSISSESTIEVILDGDSTSDLDLALFDASGALVERSDSLSSLEVVSACVDDDVTLQIKAYGLGEVNEYELDVSVVPGNCDGSCDDDAHEPDDDATSARYADLYYGAYTSTDDRICAYDEDWIGVYMYAGEDIYASLDFDQFAPDEDLDLIVRDASGVNLTGCDEVDPYACDAWNGQSGTSDEYMVWPVFSSGLYYVVVRGWSGSENDYDVCVGLSYGDCP